MHYDDRLATVLRARATGNSAARTQYRQLLDLLGRRKPVRGRSLAAEGWQRLDDLSEELPAAERAEIVSDIGWHITSPELVTNLANDEPAVAAAALERAHLSQEDWNTLIPRLPIRARGFLRLRRDLPPETERLLAQLGIHDRGLPNPNAPNPDALNPDDLNPNIGAAPNDDTAPIGVAVPASVAKAANDTNGATPEQVTPLELGAADEEQITDEPDSDDSAIGALVKRIEAFQRARSSAGPDTAAPRLPLGDKADNAERKPLAAFEFSCDASGIIDWADDGIAPMVEGAMLAAPDGLPLPSLRNQRPLFNAEVMLQGSPAIAGGWHVDAAPRFSETSGAFLGYAGRFRRNVESKPDADTAMAATHNPEAEQIRQILHELRTPVNAIQGFAEVIQQQLFGPVPHEYRAHAAAIAGDSARMMAGFDEMDRLAKLESGALDIEAGESDFAGIVRGLIVQLNDVLSKRMATFAETIPDTPCPVALDKREAEAIAWRLLATVAGTAGAGEEIELKLDCEPEMMRLRMQLTASLMAQDHIFASTAKQDSGALSAGVFGAGFALRLVRAEANAAGGMLDEADDWLTLSLPHLTAIGAQPSDGAISQS